MVTLELTPEQEDSVREQLFNQTVRITNLPLLEAIADDMEEELADLERRIEEICMDTDEWWQEPTDMRLSASKINFD